VLDSLPSISVQRLFAVAVFLKILFAILGFLLNDPIWLGMVIPILVMCIYMAVGYRTHASDVSEEKFADSCYYMGFIFTIVTIIVCLVDVPNLSPGQGLFEIAMRFGAAMISTVLGMIVRVYLVSFKKDTDDAIKDIEATLIDSTRAFTLQIRDTVRNLKDFEDQVAKATKASVENVQLQVESLGKNTSNALLEYFEKLRNEHRVSLQALLYELQSTTGEVGEVVKKYSSGIDQNLQNIENNINDFVGAVTHRLQNTTFPDDFFVQTLREPMENLKNEASRLGTAVNEVSGTVLDSSQSLGESLKILNTKTKAAQKAMSSVVDLSDQQRGVFDKIESHSRHLGALAERLNSMGSMLQSLVQTLEINTKTSLELQQSTASLVSNTSSLHQNLRDELAALFAKISTDSGNTSEVLDWLRAFTNEIRSDMRTVISNLDASNQSSNNAAAQIAASVAEIRIISGTTAQTNAGVRAAAQVSADSAKQLVEGVAQIVHSIQVLNSSISQQSDGSVESGRAAV